MNRGSRILRDRRRLEVIHASMRPRFMNRGSVAKAATHLDAALASMRPRFMNRGSVVYLPINGKIHGRLQ